MVCMAGGDELRRSWQPTQLSVSPGMAVTQLRIKANAQP